MSTKDEWLERFFLSGPSSKSCEEWGPEAPENIGMPTQKCYPVRHGIGCKGHREFMPSIHEMHWYSAYRYEEWLKVKEEYL
jgi:hypothetical protein